MRLPFLGLLICVTLGLSLPSPVSPVAPGLDPSWQWALNSLAFSESGIGQSAFFTNGPLAFALYPQPVLANALAALLCNLLFIGVWGGLLTYLATSLKLAADGILFVLLCFLLPAPADWRWSVLTVALIYAASLVPDERKKAIVTLSALVGALTVLTSLFKFTLAITAVLTTVASLFYLLLFSRRRLLLMIPAYALSLAAAALAARLAFFHSFAEFGQWCVLSWKISEGYNQAMPTPLDFAHREILFVLAYLGTFAVLALFRETWSLRRLALFIPLLPLFFLVYKHNITRAGCGTSRALVCVVPFATALLALFCDAAWRRRIRWLFLGQWVLGFLVFNVAAIRNPGAFQMGLSAGNARDSLFLRKSVSAAAIQSEKNLAPLVLPQGWRDVVSTNTFQSIPVELTYAPANGFSYTPFPFLQTYSAYRQDLDEYAAALYASPKAPRFILVQWETIDRRHLLLDTPATWNAILSRYRLLLSDNTKLLLVRSEPAAAQPLVPVRTTTLRTKEWLDCPPDDAGGLRLSIDWRQTSADRKSTRLNSSH